MTFTPVFVKQLDGSRCEGQNCGPASHSTFVNRATRGAKRGSAPAIRNYINLFCPGTTFAQNRNAIAAIYGVTDVEYHWGIAMSAFEAGISAGRGAAVGIMYSVMHGTPFDSFPSFNGRHFLFVNAIRYNSALGRREALVYDPGADGRFAYIPKGPDWWPLYLLEKAMNAYSSGTLEVQFTRNTEWVNRAAKCAAKLRSGPGTNYPIKASVSAGTVLYTSISTLPGSAWTLTCGTAKSGTGWLKVTAVNGKSTTSLYGVAALYIASGWC